MCDDKMQINKLKLPRGYRSCFVPLCKNNSKNCPDKVFVHVPNDQKKKKLWFTFARRPDLPTNSHFYCCQDHFNLEEDLENYLKFKLLGGPIKIKQNVVPRFFDCQPDRIRAAKSFPRQAHLKLQHNRVIQEILSEQQNHDDQRIPVIETEKTTCNVSAFSYSMDKENIVALNEESSSVETLNLLPSSIVQNFNLSTASCSFISEENASSFEKTVIAVQDDMFHEDSEVPIQVLKERNNQNNQNVQNTQSNIIHKKKVCTKNIQVSIKERKHYRSIGIQFTPKTISRSTSCNNINKEIKQNFKVQATHVINLPVNNMEQFDSDLNTFTTSETPITTDSEYKPSSEEIKDIEEYDLQIKRNCLNMVNYFISSDSKRYIGVPQEWFWIIEHLHLATDISTDDIKLTLIKIKLNDTYVRLGNQFGMSSVRASKVFTTSVIKLANIFKKFIYFPAKKSIKQAMPIPFRANYYDVESIIDSFEIQIEKPSDPVHQALTWSEYKKCNTLKYLVSSLPDGMINYISCGYGGRISDTNLFEICGIMGELPNNCTVLAHRGFKQIDTILAKKSCKLVRPPSVTSNTKLTKEEARETKRIASLRIHIERVIRRIREFEILVPHAVLHHSIMPYIDSAVVIAVALINLQLPIIKT